MKKNTNIYIAILLVVLGSGTLLGIYPESQKKEAYLKPSGNLRRTSTLSLPRVVKENYFFEDFENMDPHCALPKEWQSISGSGEDGDKWKVGTFDTGAKLGTGCVYVEGGNYHHDHDTWLFSPIIHLSEHALYMDFNVLMPGIGSPAIKSKLEIYLCSSQSPDSVIKELDAIECITDNWLFVVRSLGEYTASQDYCLAFHCVSPSCANTICLDNIHISDGCSGEFYSEGTIFLDSTQNLQGNFRIFNNGASELEINMITDSLLFITESFPLSLQPQQDTLINVHMRESYEAYKDSHVTVLTNDPNRPEVILPVMINSDKKDYSSAFL